jgi:AmmeMemoRadiSam system protein B/AmmeMemoRadiSam system protein A
VSVKTGFVFGFIALLAALVPGAAEAQKDGSAMEQTVRKPAVAGQFYTANPEELRREITAFMDAAVVPAIDGEVVAIVSPHAGYQYSGQVAAYGYRLVRGASYDAVVVISPSHVEYFPYASIFPGEAYETPLGDIPVAAELAKLIASKSSLVKLDMRGHEVRPFQRSEHSLEVQLPFLQVALAGFKLVPIVMGDQSVETVKALGGALAEALKGKRILIVASSDLSHFYTDRKARSLDGVFQNRLREFDPDKLLRDLSTKAAEACGGGPVAAAMIAAKSLGATKCIVLDYANSGEVTGDTANVVGYVSAAMVKENRPAGDGPGTRSAGLKKPRSATDAPAGASESTGPRSEAGLTRDDKIYLLKLARSVIEAECAGRKYVIPPAPSPVMNEKRGAFVTLKESGQLRGCIGYIEAMKPLVTTIEEMAKAAAFNDYRFSPVQAREVPALEIEISVLSPITEVTDPTAIVVGKHGLIMTRGRNRGLLLPQVPIEWGWDRETFLAQTCIKAGLSEDAWKQKGTKIECFTADVFSEKELGLRK